MNLSRNIIASLLIPCGIVLSSLFALSAGAAEDTNAADISDLVLDSYSSPSSLKPIPLDELQSLETVSYTHLTLPTTPYV